MPIIFAVGLFCCDKFEETTNNKVSDLSKLSKSYFKPKNYLEKSYGNKNLYNSALLFPASC